MSPPRIAEALLRSVIADPDLEDAILGDLAEEWNERAGRSGSDPADAWYWRQALRSLPHLLRQRAAAMKPRAAFRLVARPLLAAVVLLAVPLVAMQFTDEVNWTPFDFAFMGALVLGTGFTFELAAMKTADSAYRWAVGIALAAGFLLVWVTGAVGIIGSEANPANLMYAGVLAVGLSGAFVARFRPRGMARAMAAAAVAQALVAVIAIVYGLGHPYSGAAELTVLNGFWVALFAVSARLFQSAARRRALADGSAGA